MDKSKLEVSLSKARQRLDDLEALVIDTVAEMDYAKKHSLHSLRDDAAARLKRYQKSKDDVVNLVKDLEKASGALPGLDVVAPGKGKAVPL